WLVFGEAGSRRGSDSLEAVADRAPRAVERDVRPFDEERAVGAHQQTRQLPRQLLNVDVGLELAGDLGVAGRTGEALVPESASLEHLVPDRPRLAVELGRRGFEEAPTAEHRPLEVGEVAVRHRPEAPDAARGLEGWADDLFGDHAAGFFDGCQLQLLPRARSGRKAAFADPQLVGEPLQRDRFQALGRGEL